MKQCICNCNCRKCKQCIQKEMEIPQKKVERILARVWFHDGHKKKYVSLYESMLHTYNETNQLVHSNIKERFEKYQNEEHQKLMNCYRGEEFDPGDIDYFEVGSNAADRVEQDLLMSYQFHFSSLVNLYQVFEQHMRKLLYSELNHRTSLVNTKEEMPKFATKFGEIKNVLKVLKYPYASNPYWHVIDELNKVANVYKHGDGNSAMSLYKQNKDIFVDRATRFFYYDEPQTSEEERAYIKSLSDHEREEYQENKKILIMKEELTTNTEIVLREDKTPFEKYINAIICFWESFPEHIEEFVDVEIEEENKEAEKL